MHDDVVNQGIPERFAELLNHLDASGILLGAVAGASSLQVPTRTAERLLFGVQRR
jgi:hypothetical protein